MTSTGFSRAREVPREVPLVLLLLGFLPSVVVAVRVMDALWMAAGVLVVMTGSAVARALLERSPSGSLPAGDTAGASPFTPAVAPAVSGAAPEDSTRRWLGALVISSLLTAVFEAVLLMVDPAASAALGIYAPLIAVNLLVLGSPSSFPGSPLRAVLAALRKGASFAVGLLAVALVREVLGAGTITLFPAGDFRGTIVISPLLDQPLRALGLAGGGLLCMGYLAAAVRAVAGRTARRAGAARATPTPENTK